MIKVKMIQILNSIQPLQKIGEQPLNGIQAYKISKILNALQSEINLYSEARNKLLKQCAQKLENGQIKIKDGQATILPEKINYFNQEINKLNNVEIELNINELDLNNLSHITITPKDLILLTWLIKEEESPS